MMTTTNGRRPSLDQWDDEARTLRPAGDNPLSPEPEPRREGRHHKRREVGSAPAEPEPSGVNYATEGATGNPVPVEPPPPKQAGPEQLVTLSQLAVMVGRAKETMRRWADRIPGRRARGARGSPALWNWAEARPWLMNKYGMAMLPERYPSLREPESEPWPDGSLAPDVIGLPQSAPAASPLYQGPCGVRIEPDAVYREEDLGAASPALDAAMLARARKRGQLRCREVTRGRRLYLGKWILAWLEGTTDAE